MCRSWLIHRRERWSSLLRKILLCQSKIRTPTASPPSTKQTRYVHLQLYTITPFTSGSQHTTYSIRWLVEPAWCILHQNYDAIYYLASEPCFLGLGLWLGIIRSSRNNLVVVWDLRKQVIINSFIYFDASVSSVLSQPTWRWAFAATVNQVCDSDPGYVVLLATGIYFCLCWWYACIFPRWYGAFSRLPCPGFVERNHVVVSNRVQMRLWRWKHGLFSKSWEELRCWNGDRMCFHLIVWFPILGHLTIYWSCLETVRELGSMQSGG